MPHTCQLCGAPSSETVRTERSRSWQEKNDQSTADTVGLILRIIAGFLFGSFWGRLFRSVRGSDTVRRYERIRLRLPRCESCCKQIIEPAGASFEDGALKIIVHRVFATDFERSQDFHSSREKAA
ncbi:MAG: hypothetical protein KDA96_19415 [Planctomycetaceae bacterium]|nr:hypothetical protein [Planctomycetaceae bacterium]